jgi:excisionase family DNA binding protein
MRRDARTCSIAYTGDATAVTANIFIQHYYGENMDDQPVAAMPARHFTVQSLAAYWGVSPSHIYNLIHSNALRHMRIGKAIRIPNHFIKEFEEAACLLTKRNTDFGSIQTEPFTSSGQNAIRQPKQGCRQNAFQQGQQIGKQQNNTVPNSSQD